MSCVQHIRRMNENGVKKMCRNIFSLQQTLTSITSAREPALDYARQYFELLCLTPEVRSRSILVLFLVCIMVNGEVSLFNTCLLTLHLN